MTNYNASCIRILKPDEVVERFEWAQIGSLAQQYGKTASFIEKGFRACERCGVDVGYFVERYIRGNKSVPFREDVDAAFRDLNLTGRRFECSE